MLQKLLLFLAVAALAHPADAAPRNDIETRDDALDNYIRQVINNFFSSLDTGIPVLGLPPLDPLRLGNFTVPTIQVVGGQIDASIGLAAVGGLSSLTLTTLHLDLASVSMDLRSILPYLKIYGYYNISGVFLTVFPVYGNGPFTVELFDVVMLGGGSLGLDDSGHLQLTSLVMDANYTTMAFNFENLLGGGDLGTTLNGIIGQLSGNIWDMLKPSIIEALVNGIITVVNNALSNLAVTPPPT